MNDIMVIGSLIVGGFWTSLLCAAVAIRKGRRVNVWFGLSALGWTATLIGTFVPLIILFFLPAGNEPKDKQKLLGIMTTPKALYISAAVLFVMCGFGCWSLAGSIMTILGAVKY